MGRFDGQVAVVTGGGRGIGRAVALLLAQEGAKVVVCDLGGEVRGGGADASVAEEVVAEIAAAGGTAIASCADIAAMDGAASAVAAAIDSWGRLDILFNGAGIIRRGMIHEMDEDVWDTIIRVNLKSSFAMTHYAVPHMVRQGSGSII